MINWRSSYAFALHREQDSRWSEARLILGSFLIILLIGTIFLVQPSSHNGEVTFVNALFTATSAISVTGLGVVDTGTAFTLQGQIFLLMLMEIGGLGQMTMTLLLIAIFSKRVGLRQQVLAKEALGQEGSVNIIQLVKRIVLFAFIAQLIGTGIMAIRWVPEMGWVHGLYVSFFHAVSAFNNAGFSLFANNLMDYRDDPIISLTIAGLLILGGDRLYRHRRSGAQPPLAQAEAAQQADAADDPGAAAGRYPDVLAAGTQQPRHPRQGRCRWPAAGCLLPVCQRPYRRFQYHRYRADDPGGVAVPDDVDVYRCRRHLHRWWYQSHHLRSRAAGDQGISDQTAPCHRFWPHPVAPDRDPLAGHHHRQHHGADAGDVPADGDRGSAVRQNHVRDYLGICHRRPIHRHHRLPERAGQADPGAGDDLRPSRPP